MDAEERNDFLFQIKNKPSQELVTIYIGRDNYEPDFIDLIKEELEGRGFSPEEIVSHEGGSAYLLANMRDDELVDIFVHANEYPTEWVDQVEMEIEKRNLPIDDILQTGDEEQEFI